MNIDDLYDRAQQAGEERLALCSELLWHEDNDVDPDGLRFEEIVAPYDGCEKCVVREVLHAAIPIVKEIVRAEDLEAIDVNFTTRELQVLDLVVEGLTDSKMGELLHISSSTIKHHLGNIYDKLGVFGKNSRVSAAVKYMEMLHKEHMKAVRAALTKEKQC